jgi:hypothetical protein
VIGDLGRVRTGFLFGSDRRQNVPGAGKAYTDAELVVQKRDSARVQRFLDSIDVFTAASQHAMASLQAQNGRDPDPGVAR